MSESRQENEGTSLLAHIITPMKGAVDDTASSTPTQLASPRRQRLLADCTDVTICGDSKQEPRPQSGTFRGSGSKIIFVLESCCTSVMVSVRPVDGMRSL